MLLDVHNHYYPPEFIAAVRKGPSKYTVEEDASGNPVLVSPGDKNFVVPGHRDIAFRQAVIEGAGVDMQVITLTAPGTTMEEPATSAYLASLVNDALAKVREERPTRFTALATLPLNDPAASARAEPIIDVSRVCFSFNGQPVLQDVVLDMLNLRQDVTYVDATIGPGGHSEHIIKSLGSAGRLIGIDRDPEALKIAAERLPDKRVTLIRGRFSDMEHLLLQAGISQIDGVLFDIGISMVQMRDPLRGFSFLSDEYVLT